MKSWPLDFDLAATLNLLASFLLGSFVTWLFFRSGSKQLAREAAKLHEVTKSLHEETVRVRNIAAALGTFLTGTSETVTQYLENYARKLEEARGREKPPPP